MAQTIKYAFRRMRIALAKARLLRERLRVLMRHFDWRVDYAEKRALSRNLMFMAGRCYASAPTRSTSTPLVQMEEMKIEEIEVCCARVDDSDPESVKGGNW